MSYGVPPQGPPGQYPQGQYPQGPYPQQGQPPVDPMLALVVPVGVKNGWAVASGYLGIFSLFFGPFLGIPAIILGVIALRKPELGGKGRAWTGIIMGSLTSLAILLLVLFRA